MALGAHQQRTISVKNNFFTTTSFLWYMIGMLIVKFSFFPKFLVLMQTQLQCTANSDPSDGHTSLIINPLTVK